ncbi:MAG TPA: HK97-gp10 family putative phage morphogenesis protein [Sphingobium sp.]|nr:HK97-gp10 family putative phage morphogenesis protein [Sphingobium sp.]
MSRAVPMKGLKETMAFLEAFPARIQKGAVRSALTAAAKPVRDQARANAPRESGMMAKAIKTGSPRVEQDGTVSIKVRLAGPHSYIGHFIEHGVAPHFISAGDSVLSARTLTQKLNRDGSEGDAGAMKIGDTFVTGAVPHPGFAAKPFMRPALDTKADEAVQAFGDRLRSYLKDKTGFTAPARLDEVEE